MEISEYSRKHFNDICEYWSVDQEYYEHMFNYLVYGFRPGSFFYFILCNDWSNAIIHSHPSNRVENLKSLTKWILNRMPPDAWGNSSKVESWMRLSNTDRRKVLEEYDLLLTPEQETWKALTDERITEYV